MRPKQQVLCWIFRFDVTVAAQGCLTMVFIFPVAQVDLLKGQIAYLKEELRKEQDKLADGSSEAQRLLVCLSCSRSLYVEQ